MGLLPPRPQSLKNLNLNLSRQAVLKGLFAATLTVVLVQIAWYYYSNSSELPIPFQHRNPPSTAIGGSAGPGEQHEDLDHVFSYGAADCFPGLKDLEAYDVANHTAFCESKGRNITDPAPRLATVTAQFGTPQSHYQRALGTHVLHNAVQKTGIHILCAKIVDDLWNKPAFILDLLFTEMEKPENERLEWIFWVDRDTIILDTCRSPLSYLPKPLHKEPPPMPPVNQSDPEAVAAAEAAAAAAVFDAADNINMLATTDWNGLNNGVFLLRVCSWSVDLFIAILAFRYYRPDVELVFTEQSAMANLLEEPKFKDQVVWVPHWWFNAYPRGREREDFTPVSRDKNVQGYHARRGDFLVHFAGLGQRGKSMEPWLDVAENATTGWATERKERFLDAEITAFWDRWRGGDGTA